MATRFKSTLEKFDGNLWGLHISVPDNIAESLIIGDNKRVLCTLNNTITLNCALMKSKLYWFVLVNQQVQKKLGVQVGQNIEVQIEKDNSEYGFPIPEELTVLLDQDEEGNKLFHSLTPGRQRSLIYIVTKVKNTNSRLNKALAIVYHLKEQKGNLDFKLLNKTIKDYNNRSKLL